MKRLLVQQQWDSHFSMVDSDDNLKKISSFDWKVDKYLQNELIM
jgi:hypothetical protein